MSLPTKRSTTAVASCSSPFTPSSFAPSDDAVLDPSSMPLDDNLPNARAANLFRKRATFPLPAKKLLVKLHKDPIQLNPSLLLKGLMLLRNRSRAVTKPSLMRDHSFPAMSQPFLLYDVLGRRKYVLPSFVLVYDNCVFLFYVCDLVLIGIEDNWRSDLSKLNN
ncbi:Cullin-4 protein [Spatholobus suberectus]|nr:Cullin-4 protein [Spatholobus suberectus]